MKRLDERILDKLMGISEASNEGSGVHVKFVHHLLNYDHSIKNINRAMLRLIESGRLVVPEVNYVKFPPEGLILDD